MARTLNRSRRGLVIGLVALLVVVLGVAGYLVLRPSAGPDTADSAGTDTPGAVANGVVDPPVVAQPQAITALTPLGSAPTPDGIAAAVKVASADPGLGRLSGYVMDPATGTVLMDVNGGDRVSPASTMKLLTGAAVLSKLNPQSRLVTKVVQGDEPGTIVFVGGGDVTLSARAAGVDTIYDGAPTISELAQEVLATGVKPTKIVLDTSLYTGSNFANGWLQVDIGTDATPGYITRMSPLMVDGDRYRPGNVDSGRTGDPAVTAGKALALALGVPNAEIVPDGKAADGAAVLGQVTSQPVSVLLAQALENSDNILAEALAREVSRTMGGAASFEGVSASLLINLQDLGLDTTGVTIADGSGLSTQDKVPTKLLAQIVGLAVNSTGNLRDLLTGLPIAGASGTLATRFSLNTAAAGARGWVRAKTGSLGLTYALAGLVLDVDNRILVFSFVSNGVNSTTSRPAQDALAATLRNCGCS